MKIAISIPDDIFDKAERRASALDMSRSEFFATAARHYLDELDAQSLTARIDDAIDLLGGDQSGEIAAQAGRRMLAHDEPAAALSSGQHAALTSPTIGW